MPDSIDPIDRLRSVARHPESVYRVAQYKPGWISWLLGRGGVPENPDRETYECRWCDRYAVANAIIGAGESTPVAHPTRPGYYASTVHFAARGPIRDIDGRAEFQRAWLEVIYAKPMGLSESRVA